MTHWQSMTQSRRMTQSRKTRARRLWATAPILLALAAAGLACSRPTTDIAACPPAGLTADTEQMRLRTSTGRMAEITLYDLRLTCRRHKKSGEIRPRYAVYGSARLADAAAARDVDSAAKPGRAEFLLYGALLDPKQAIRVRRLEKVSLALRSQPTRFVVRFRNQNYTPRKDERAYGYTVLAGLVMTPAQIRVNRQRNRQRIAP